MHIVMLSDNETQGGAAVAASRLAEGLCRAGHRVTRLVNVANEHEHDWVTQPLNCANINSPSLGFRIARRLLRSRVQTQWDRHTAQERLKQALIALCPDVINVHNLHGASRAGWSSDMLSMCTNHAPTVWTLHDMWSFTGRCAYSYDCRKFLTGCDSTCPTPKEYPTLAPERIAGAWKERRRLLASQSRLVAVTPSRWLAQEAQAGLWAGHRVEVIPYGLPLKIYHPLDRTLAREALGIERHGLVLLVAAQNLTERRKGGNLLVEALQMLSHRPLTLITLGSRSLRFNVEGIHLCSLGYIDNDRIKVLAYSAADLLAHPAPVDNLPHVVMEAVACGTPVVCFPTGGLPELVCRGRTGWLAEEVSPSALAKAIEEAIGELQIQDWRLSCRAVAEAEYGVGQQAQRYIDLFESFQTAEPKSETEVRDFQSSKRRGTERAD